LKFVNIDEIGFPWTNAILSNIDVNVGDVKAIPQSLRDDGSSQEMLKATSETMCIPLSILFRYSLRKWCPAVALSRQDGHHSAVALLLKAVLIQVSDYRLLGASGL
jgi:hypothetical protein